MPEIDIFGWKIDSAHLASGPVSFKSYTLIPGRPESGGMPFKLQIGSCVSVFFRATSPYTYQSINKFRLSDRCPLTDLETNSNPLFIELAGLKLLSPNPTVEATRNDLHGLQLRPDDFSQDFQDYPIQLAAGGLLGIDLTDPDKPFLYFSAGAFQLTTRSIASGRTDLFERTYTSREKRVLLLDAASHTQVDLEFEVVSDNALPLYCDRLADETLAVAMTVDSCRLHLSMAAKQGVDNQVSRIWLEPSEAGLRLTTYALSDAGNEPAIWRLAGRFIDLNCRLYPSARPTTLVFAPVQAAAAGATPSGDVNDVFVIQEGTKSVHGPVADSEFFLRGATGALVCELEDSCTEKRPDSGSSKHSNNAAIAKTVIGDLTFPWLRFAKDASHTPQFRHTKPGVAYCQENGGASIETLTFEGPELAFPLLPLDWISSSSKECQMSLVGALNEQVKNEGYHPQATIHETHFHEAPMVATQQVQLTGLFYRDDKSGTLKARPQILDYPSKVDFGLAKVRVELGGDPQSANDPRKYVVIKRKDVLNHTPEFAKCLGDFTILPSSGSDEDIVGVLKLSREVTLQDILDGEAKQQTKGQIPDLREVLHSSLQERAWTGLILFKLSVNCQDATKTPVLKDIIPKTGIPVSYIALTPKKTTSQTRFSICARIKWENPVATGAKWTGTPQDEVRCFLKALDVAWFDSSLTNFHSDTELHFEGFFGQREGARDLSIQGSYDEATRTIRFTGAFAQPVHIVGSDAIKPFGPIQSVDVSAATIESVDGKTSFSLNGSVRLGKWGGSNFFSETDKPLEYRNLRLFFEHALDAAGSWLNISYPSFRFPFSIPVLKFLSFELNLDSLAVDWTPNDDPWKGFLSFQPGTLSFPSVRFGFKIDLMKLPLLAWKNIDRLTLEVLLGFERTNVRVGVGFTGFETGNEQLKLDLLRFLKLTIEKVTSKEFPVSKIKALVLHKISLEILEKKIVTGLEVVVFSGEQGRHGFLAFYIPSDDGAKPSDTKKASDNKKEAGKDSAPDNSQKDEKKDSNPTFLKIHWILIAQNLRLPSDMLNKLMELPAIDPSGQPPADTCALLRTDDTYVKGINKLSDEIVPAIDQTGLTSVDQWMFGAGFRVLNILEGKFLFQDGYYYGIALDSPAFCHWFGFNLAISVVYVKGTQPSDDQFTLTFRAPRITLPACAFTGGTISLQIRVDGSFLIDIGFPWVQNGVRRWDRALGAIVTPFQGSGGFYLRRQTISGYAEEGQTHNGIIIGAGLAIQFGLGGAYGGAGFRVTASIGIFAVVEGDALFLDNNLDGLVLIGSVGLLGRASGELNWWIISIRVEVLLIAEARLQFAWGCNPRLASVNNACDRQKPTLTFQMTVYASVSASACIGWGPFQVCAGITLSIAIPISPEVKLIA